MATAKTAKKTKRNQTEGRTASDKQSISLKEPAKEEIERRAYEIYLARVNGYDQDDWLQAEREIKEAQS